MALLSNLYPGIKGAQGIQGIRGTSGPQGTQGTQGIQGVETKGFNVTEVNGLYSLQTSDVGNLIKINSGIYPAVSISSNTFSFGNSFMVYNGTSNTQTISQGVGVSFYSGDGTATLGSKYINENEMATILCSSSNDEFIFSGAYGNIPDIVRDGLVLFLDAGDSTSYPGGGTTWTDLSDSGNQATISGATYSSDNGGYLDFDGVNDDCSITSTPPINGNEMTFSVWNYGISLKESSIIYLAGSSGVRNLNVHLPWSNSIVYFDAGDGVGYDRIAKTASNSEYQGWHHWVFTKNATNGTMYIYLDGSLWHSGTGRTRTIGTPDTIRSIGSSSSSNYHRGYISNLQLYNKELTSSEIQQNFEASRVRYGL
jgi:hypothetical protein